MSAHQDDYNHEQEPDSAEWATELENKNRVIEALTERLAETADQLDRLQRMGLDRPGRTPAGPGMSREMIEQQQEVHTQLSDFMANWEQAQPIDTLQRIEEHVLEILGRIKQGNISTGSGGAAPTKPAQPKPEAKPEAKSDAPAGGADFWAAAKARLLNAAEGGTPAATPNPATSPAQPESPPAASRTPVEQMVYTEVLEEPAPPKPVDPGASKETLEEAVDARDAYIAYLVSKVRRLQEEARQPISPEELEQVPASLAAQVEKLRDELQEQLKQAEMMNALERASLTRDRQRLQQVKQMLQDRVAKMGGATKETKPTTNEEARLNRLLTPRK